MLRKHHSDYVMPVRQAEYTIIHEFKKKNNCMHFISWVILPLAGQVGLSTGDHRVSCQHFKGAGFPCPIHSQQTKALQERRDNINIRKAHAYFHRNTEIIYIIFILLVESSHPLIHIILTLRKLSICTTESLAYVACIVPLQGGCRHTAGPRLASVSACKSWWAAWAPRCLTVLLHWESSVALWPRPRLLLQ